MKKAIKYILILFIVACPYALLVKLSEDESSMVMLGFMLLISGMSLLTILESEE